MLGTIVYKYCEIIINKVYLPIRHYSWYGEQKEKKMAKE